MKKLLFVLLALSATAWLTWHLHLWPVAETASKAALSVEAPSEVPSNCPIRAVRPGMSFNEVHKLLRHQKMDDRGTRQDEDVYYVTTSICHAFLDFSSLDGRLDVIDYGLGFDKIEFRKNAPSAMNDPAPTSSSIKADNRTKPQHMGFPVPETTFVNAYVLANIGRDNLDQNELGQLAHDEYTMGKSIDTQTLLLGGSVLDTRGMRAMKYLDHLSHQQRQTENTGRNQNSY